MECKKIIREEEKVFMIDSNNFKLEISDINELSRYENKNSVQLTNMVNKFFSERETKFITIINDIESMVKKYNIDYSAYGECAGYARGTLAMIYNIKNRKSTIDCIFKVFYSENENLRFMIDFSSASSGSTPGYHFYLHFGYEGYYNIKQLIEDYFKLNDDSNGEIKLLDYLYNKVKESKRKYYLLL